MGKKIAALVVGYVAMSAFVFVAFALAYLALGTDGAFKPGSYEISTIWMVLSVIIGLVGATIGGLVCVLIAKDCSPVKWLAGVVLVLGFLFAIPVLTADNEDTPKVRTDDVPAMEAMQNAKQPGWVALLNPLLGAAGVMLGGALKKPK